MVYGDPDVHGGPRMTVGSSRVKKGVGKPGGHHHSSHGSGGSGGGSNSVGGRSRASLSASRRKKTSNSPSSSPSSSSSGDHSDTTYPDSEVAGVGPGGRGDGGSTNRMQGGGVDSPPEPAPPEVPPRGPSLHHTSHHHHHHHHGYPTSQGSQPGYPQGTLRHKRSAVGVAPSAPTSATIEADGTESELSAGYHTANTPSANACIFLSQEYLMSGSPRAYAAKSPKSPLGGGPIGCDGGAADAAAKDFMQESMVAMQAHRLTPQGGIPYQGPSPQGQVSQALGPSSSSVAPSTPIVMPVFPVRSNSIGGGALQSAQPGTSSSPASSALHHAPHHALHHALHQHHHPAANSPYSAYSPSRFHIDKRCQHRCSWKCVSIALILLSVALTAMLGYFAALSSSRPRIDGTGCILVEESDGPAEAAAAAAQDRGGGALGDGGPREPTAFPPPTEETFQTSTSGSSSGPGSLGVQGSAGSPGRGGGSASAVGAPGGTGKDAQWPVVEVRELGRPHRARIPPFRFWNAEFRNKQPAFIRMNFTLPWGSHFAVYGRRNVAPSVTQYDFVEFIRGGRMERLRRAALEGEVDLERERRSAVSVPAGGPSTSTAVSSVPGSATVNVSMLQYLDTGRWFLSVYNDDLRQADVLMVVEEAEGVSTACPNDCSGRGSCYLGKCDCIDGYQGSDCSKSVCPVLCSNHGQYGGGLCHCEEGWKGSECDVPERDCEVPDCSGRGRCINGKCRCAAGWKGNACELEDCPDPECGGHGTCVGGRCHCKAGWTGTNCSSPDERVSHCLPSCSDHGAYDLEAGACVCDKFWSGPDCSRALCSLDCGPHGRCDKGGCLCDPGWSGERCDLLPCDARCSAHGQCKNGTCVCSQGWNGRHCTLPGCKDGCSRHGSCAVEDGEYKCACAEGWAGSDCSIRLELECADETDNDGDGMVDCSDSECCTLHPSCSDHIMCLASNDPVEVLLRKQPPPVTASFYQRVKFLIEENSVQSYAHMDEYSESQFWNSFTPRRVSVIRGRVVTPQGLGIIGIRVSVDRDSRFGFTLTRSGGWFDVLVNGGGAVTLQFQRSPFLPLTRTVFVPWNQIVVVPPISMSLGGGPRGSTPLGAGGADPYREQSGPRRASLSAPTTSPTPPLQQTSPPPPPLSRYARPCPAHNTEYMRPVIFSTWLPDAVGGAPGENLVFAETQILQESIGIPGSFLHLLYHSSQAPGYLATLLMRLTPSPSPSFPFPSSLTLVHLRVEIEGSVFEKSFEADPGLEYTFAWNKRNVYKQKVYGVATARVSVGYEYDGCDAIVWEPRTALMRGFDVDVSDVGGWSLDVHHHYNFHEGILQKGDGSTLHFKQFPRIVRVAMGTGTRRPLLCGASPSPTPSSPSPTVPDPACVGPARDAKLLTPVALASGPDGSLYVGDFNLVRRLTPEGTVYTVLQLSATQVSYQYYLSVSPADGHLYVSDPERHQVVRVLSVEGPPAEPALNSEPAVGSGERCIPGDEAACGDGGPARHAKLAHPKGLAIAADKTMYIADGTNIRAVDTNGIIHTLVGHHGHHNHWRPIPCRGAIPSHQAQLQWPTALALSPLDGSLHFVDDRLVLKLTADMKVVVVAGTPLHCPPRGTNAGGESSTSSGSTSARSGGQEARSGETNLGTDEQGWNNGGSEAVPGTHVVLGTVLSISFSPLGDLFLAQSDSRKANTIWVVDSAGNIAHFAGQRIPGMGENGRGGCSGGSDCGSNNTIGGVGVTGSIMGMGLGGEAVLSTNAHFESISAIACSPDGILHIADRGSLHLFSLEHYLPSANEAGEFHVPHPPTREVYTFNRHGQHVATRDLASGKPKRTFLYTKNTSFGKLSTVIDASGNRVVFLRDYAGAVSTVESGQDRKSELRVSGGVGALVRFRERGGAAIELDYDGSTGLLTSRASNSRSGAASLYRYTSHGRLSDAVLPTGEALSLVSKLIVGDLWDGSQADQTAPNAGGGLEVRITRDNRNPVYIRMGANGRRLLVRGADNTASEARMYRNGSFRVRPASGSSSSGGISVDGSAGFVELTGGITATRHPLLELALPVEAEMMPVSTSQRLRLGVVGGGSGSNVGGTGSGSAGGITSGDNYMEIRYGLVGDVRGPLQTLRTDIWVNSTRVLCIELEQATSRETLLDWEEAPLVTVQYDPISNLPMAWLPSPALQAVPINISYDRFSRVAGWHWGDESEQYTYERHGLLSEIYSPEDGKTQFTYNDMNLVNKITLPSGRHFTIQYDEEGGVRHITLPSGTRHAFSAQLSLGFVRVSYTPPGSSRPYLQHFGHGAGGAATSALKCGTPHLLQTVFPGDGARVVYRYDHASRLSEVVHGDGRTQIRYGPSPSPFPTEILHSERDFEYRWDGQLLSSGLGGGDFGGGRGKDGLLVEERLDFGAKTGLSSAKFAYERSSSGVSGGSFWRVTSITGRIGGQALPEHTLAYSLRTGEPTAIAHFRVARPRPNETTLSDGTALFSRIVDSKFREVQVSLTIHRMEVFRLEFHYGSVRENGAKSSNGQSSATSNPPTTSPTGSNGPSATPKGPTPGHRIGQTKTYTRNVGVNTYTNIKNYTYDSDGQLSGVEAQEPWGFRYDANGNLLSLTYRGNVIPMEYSSLDRIAKFGDGAYRYNVRGLVVQNAREEKFQYNARGLLSRATKRGRFDVRYFYDHKDRLAARKDNYGNVTQFFYANHERPNEVSYIYSPRDGKLMWLIYDDRGHLVFAQAHRHKYYVATDQCGTPVMVFNQYGEGIREIMRSPYGHIVYDSNPYLYLPIDFCGGLLDQVTSLVHMPGGKVYDPLIGQWMTPQWEDVLDRLAKAPTHLHLYRFNGNDPINVKKRWRLPTDHLAWLELLGYDLRSLAPQLFPESLPGIPTAALPKFEEEDYSECRAPNLAPPFRAASGFLAHLAQYRLGAAGLAALPARAAEMRAKWPRGAGSQPRLPPFRIAATEPPFGRGIVVSRMPGGKVNDVEDGWGLRGDRAVVSSAPSANAIFRDVFTSVFNRSLLLRPALLVHSQEAFFFVKEEAWRAAEDVAQLRRLGGQLNVTLHERDATSPSPTSLSSSGSSSGSERAVDLKIHGAGAVVNVRYGTTPEREVMRLLHHAKNAAVRKAWQRELELLRAGLAGPVGGGVGASGAVGVGMGAGSGAAGGGVEWTPAEAEEIAKVGYASAYEGVYVHDPRRYPELAEDPFNIRFVKRSRDESGRDHSVGRKRRSSADGWGSSLHSLPSNLSSSSSTMPALEQSRTCKQWWLPWKQHMC